MTTALVGRREIYGELKQPLAAGFTGLGAEFIFTGSADVEQGDLVRFKAGVYSVSAIAPNHGQTTLILEAQG